MIYRYLSLSLAIGLTLSSTNPGLSSTNSDISENKDSFQTSLQIDEDPQQKESEVAPLETAQLKETSYLGLMSAGYNAKEKNNYSEALDYFRQALSLRPDDSKAKKAIAIIGSQGFDSLMQAGYSADKTRDYDKALTNFQKALKIRPDSWHAQKAISNVRGYLAQQPVTTPVTTEANRQPQTSSTSQKDKDSNSNVWFSFILLSTIGAFTLGLLFYLFQKTGKTIINSPEETNGISDEEIFEDIQENISEDTPNTPDSTEAVSDNIDPQNSDSDNKDAEIISSRGNLVKLDIVPELVQELNSGDRSIRRKAVWELAQRGDSRAMKPLVELMVEVDSQERGLILEAMTQIAGRTLKPMNKALMLSLNDENSQVKQNAIRDLTRVYELMSQVTKRLSLAVEDSDAQVQETAKWALQKLNQMPNTSAWNMVDNVPQDAGRFNGAGKSQNSNGSSASARTPRREYPFN